VSGWARYTGGNVLLSDEAVLALNKPAGIAVMGERHETDLVRLAAEAGEQLFPVHRIDKVTSGAVLFARDLRWHSGLTRQFARRTAGKAYLAVTTPGGLPRAGTIDLPLSVGRKNRVRVAAPRASIGTDGHTWSVPAAQVFGEVRSYPSVTTFTTLWQDERHALLAVHPVTGRRHQIRVHLALLHSWRLAFDAAWRDGARVTVEAPPGEDFWAPVRGTLPGNVDALLAGARDEPG